MADKWEWRTALVAAHMNQQDVAAFLGLSKSQMAQLVTKMVTGKGLTATALDKERWEHALAFVQLKQSEIKQEV